MSDELTKEQRKEQIAALLRERSFLGSPKAEIDKQLQLLGYEAKTPAKRAVQMKKPKGTEL